MTQDSTFAFCCVLTWDTPKLCSDKLRAMPGSRSEGCRWALGQGPRQQVTLQN